LSGAEAALQIWTEFMKNATASMPITEFPVPIERMDSEDAKCGTVLREGELKDPCAVPVTPVKTPAGF
jgi:membrane carboxypeptidase/penicillin-binding protein